MFRRDSVARDPNVELVQFGAFRRAAHAVAPYEHAPACDDERVIDLIQRMARGEIDMIAFTSAPHVDRLWSAARERSALVQEIVKALS